MLLMEYISCVLGFLFKEVPDNLYESLGLNDTYLIDPDHLNLPWNCYFIIDKLIKVFIKTTI